MLSTAVIGAGTMGLLYARAFHDSDIAQLSAVVDIDADRAHNGAAAFAGATAYTSVDELLTAGGIDAAAVSLPDTPTAKRWSPCSMPVSTCCARSRSPRASRTARTWSPKASGAARLMVNYGNRHRPEALALRDVIRSGVLGELQAITMKGNEKLAKTRQLAWRDRTDPTWFLISHLVDFVSWLTDERFAGRVRPGPRWQGRRAALRRAWPAARRERPHLPRDTGRRRRSHSHRELDPALR